MGSVGPAAPPVFLILGEQILDFRGQANWEHTPWYVTNFARQESANVPHKIKKLPVFGAANNYTLLLLELLLRAILLRLDGI